MKELLTRAFYGAIYAALIVFCTMYSPWTLYMLYFVLLLIALYEFKKLIKLEDNWIYVAGTLCYASFVSYEDFNLNRIIFVGVLSLFFPLIIQLFKKSGVTNQAGHFYLAFFYIVVSFILLAKIPFLLSYNSFHPFVLLAVFILIWVNDSFAYLVGKTIGKHKLMERISPKKTIEGFLGGLVFALATGYIISIYNDLLALNNWLIIALLVVVFGTIGDLIESKFKREAGVKDSGAIMPGHGGILDRLDSVIFAAPFVFYYLMTLQN